MKRVQPETLIRNAVQVEASRVGSRLWRNVVSLLYTRDGTPVKVGFCDGSSDLIGLTPVTVTPDMVGQKVALFTALEVKTCKGVASDAQKAFISMVREQGGIAAIVRSVEDARQTLGNK